MEWRFALAAKRKRLAILVSQADHALQELLRASRPVTWRPTSRWSFRTIAMSSRWSIRTASSFTTCRSRPTRRTQAEDQLLELLAGQVDTVVLARYMQILCPRFLAAFPNEAINIHHSFLPAFVGADPYAQAAGAASS